MKKIWFTISTLATLAIHNGFYVSQIHTWQNIKEGEQKVIAIKEFEHYIDKKLTYKKSEKSVLKKMDIPIKTFEVPDKSWNFKIESLKISIRIIVSEQQDILGIQNKERNIEMENYYIETNDYELLEKKFKNNGEFQFIWGITNHNYEAYYTFYADVPNFKERKKLIPIKFDNYALDKMTIIFEYSYMEYSS